MVLALIALAGCAPVADQPQPAAGVPPAADALPDGLDDAGYLAIADTIVPYIGVHWDDRSQSYQPGRGGTITELNADLLLVHSVAALADHHGASRNDARARAIARLITGPRIWRGGSWPGWKAAPGNIGMHVVFEAKPPKASRTLTWRATPSGSMPRRSS
jgi:hypothetical protein